MTKDYRLGIRPYGKFSLIGYFVFSLCAVTLIAEMILGVFDNPLNTIWLVLVMLLSAVMFVRGEGVEVDKSENRIRGYRSYYGIRGGQWYRLSDFDELSYRISRYTVKFEVPDTYDMGVVEQHASFELWITGTNTEKEFMLNESSNYQDGVEKARLVSSELGIPFVDECLEELRRSQQRRKLRRR